MWRVLAVVLLPLPACDADGMQMTTADLAVPLDFYASGAQYTSDAVEDNIMLKLALAMMHFFRACAA